MTAPSTPRATPDAPEGVAWLLYDGSCGFCSRWVSAWESTLRKRRIHVAPLQEEWVAKRLGLCEAEVVEDLRLLLPGGSVVVGADVYREAMRRIWWAHPFYLLSLPPLLRQVFDACYRGFARHRHRISRTCRMPGEAG